MSIADEYNINNLEKMMARQRFAEVVSPFFEGEHWELIKEARQYYLNSRNNIQNDLHIPDLEKLGMCAEKYHEWMNKVLQAILDKRKEMDEERKKSDEEFQAMMDRINNTTDEQVSAFWEGINQMFNTRFDNGKEDSKESSEKDFQEGIKKDIEINETLRKEGNEEKKE